MTAQWNTKYGPRRVRHDPPDLSEAIAAAQGLTDDVAGQAEIAAQLMGVDVEYARTEIERLAAAERAAANKRSRTLTIAAPRRGGQTQAVVVVERRSMGRPIRRVYDV
jgi:hypothetical protein